MSTISFFINKEGDQVIYTVIDQYGNIVYKGNYLSIAIYVQMMCIVIEKNRRIHEINYEERKLIEKIIKEINEIKEQHIQEIKQIEELITELQNKIDEIDRNLNEEDSFLTLR